MSWKYQKDEKDKAKAPLRGMKICVKQPQLLEPTVPEAGPEYEGWDNPELVIYDILFGKPYLRPVDQKKKPYHPFYPLVWFEFNP